MIIKVGGKLYTNCETLIKRFPSTYGRIYERLGTPSHIREGSSQHRKEAKEKIFLARTYSIRKAHSIFGGWK